MELLSLFSLGVLFENIFIWHAVGLGVIVLFSYTMQEVFWVSIRFSIFVLVQTIIMLWLRPRFAFAGQELFLLSILIAIEVLLSAMIDFLLPQSRLEDSISGFIRRGDAILPFVFAIIISKKLPPVESLVYSLGISVGFISMLCMITAISIVFNFHRLTPRHVYALKLCILGVLSVINY